MRRQRRAAVYSFLMPTIKEMRLAGKTMIEIATWLNDHGHTTSAGAPFTQTAVHRLLKRYLGDDFLGRAADSHGNSRVIRCMETVK